MIYGYTRVSTHSQYLENQTYGINQYCKQHNMKVDIWYEEKISGTKKVEDRELGKLIKLLKKGDVIICTEISRVGRSTIDVLNTIKEIRDRDATLIAIKQGFVLDDSLNSKIMSMVFAMVSEIEREILSMRVKEGLAARKAKGIKLGRPYGTHNKHNKLEARKDFIETMFKGGASRYQIKKQLKCHSHTLNNYLLVSGIAKKYNIDLSEFTENVKTKK